MKEKQESFDSAQDDQQPESTSSNVPLGGTSEAEGASTPTITENLITALLETYQPAEITDENTELKTSIDLMEEMAPIADVEKWEIAIAMEKANFKLKYTDAGVFWILKKR